MPHRAPLFALAGGALLGALSAAELGLRTWLGPRTASWASVGQSGPPPGYYLQSRSTGTATSTSFSGTTTAGVPVHTDRLGLRVTDPAADRSGAGWLVLGDSFTAALQVSAETSFVGRLERRLGVPVHNAGIDGASTWVAARRAEQLVQQLDLKGVLLVFYTGNDLEESAQWGPQAEVRRAAVDGRPFPVGPDRYAALRPLLARSLLTHLALGSWEARTRPLPGPDSTPARQLLAFHEDGAQLLQQWTRPTQGALDHLHATVDRAGLPLVVAIAPPVYVVRPSTTAATFTRYGLDPAGARLSAPGDAVRAIVARRNVPVCELEPALKAAESAGQDPYYIFEGHWAPTGHAAVAEALAGCLARL